MCFFNGEDRRYHDFLEHIDVELAVKAKAGGCKHCGAALHEGGFERKPRGVAAKWREIYEWRTSYDCSVCRKRTLALSVRFMGRRLYVAPVLALVNPRGPAQRSWLCRTLKVPAATVRRWRAFWQERFACSSLWELKRAFFAPPVDETLLPGSAIERFAGVEESERIARFLNFLLPAQPEVLTM